jgi:hypothetical protein
LSDLPHLRLVRKAIKREQNDIGFRFGADESNEMVAFPRNDIFMARKDHGFGPMLQSAVSWVEKMLH